MRIGFGYDVHRLVEGRRLVLGGVEIEYPLGLLGHSDADVLLHAIMDALLGAAALGDIGRHFPPEEPRYKDVSSLTLLEHTKGLLREAGYRVVNIDATVVCEKPRLKDHIPHMTEKIAHTLGTPKSSISIKATTEEGLGTTGSGRAIAAYAVCLIEEVPVEV